MKQKISLILLLSLLIVPPLVTICWLNYQKDILRKQVKHKIIQGIDRQELVLLSFTKTEAKEKLRWKHSKEFEYKDQMYDIVESITYGDTIHYWCWWDHEETKLNKKLSVLTRQAFSKDPKQKEKRQLLNRFLQSLFFESSSDVIKTGYKLIAKQSGFYPFNYKSVYIYPPTPPPCIC